MLEFISDKDGKYPTSSQEEKYFNDVKEYCGAKVMQNIVDIFLEAHWFLRMTQLYRSQIRIHSVSHCGSCQCTSPFSFSKGASTGS